MFFFLFSIKYGPLSSNLIDGMVQFFVWDEADHIQGLDLSVDCDRGACGGGCGGCGGCGCCCEYGR